MPTWRRGRGRTRESHSAESRLLQPSYLHRNAFVTLEFVVNSVSQETWISCVCWRWKSGSRTIFATVSSVYSLSYQPHFSFPPSLSYPWSSGQGWLGNYSQNESYQAVNRGNKGMLQQKTESRNGKDGNVHVPNRAVPIAIGYQATDYISAGLYNQEMSA